MKSVRLNAVLPETRCLNFCKKILTICLISFSIFSQFACQQGTSIIRKVTTNPSSGLTSKIAGSAAQPTFDPSTLSNQVAWIKPERIDPNRNTIDGLAPFSQLDASLLPSLTASSSSDSFNGWAFATFNGTAYWNASLPASSEYSVALVIRTSQPGNLMTLGNLKWSISSGSPSTQSAGNLVLTDQTGTAQKFSSSISLTNHAIHLILMQTSTTGSQVWVDGYKVGQSLNSLTAGADNTLTATFGKGYVGDVSELIFFNRTLTSTEQDQIHCYANAKYHPDPAIVCTL